MFIALTGTPGTGKSEVAKLLSKRYSVWCLKDLVKKHGFTLGWDHQRDCDVVDLRALDQYLKNSKSKSKPTTILVGHYSHLLSVDLVIVLRCLPNELKKRLVAIYSQDKVKENVECEALGCITTEALCLGKRVYEIDTTHKNALEVVQAIEEVLSGSKRYKPQINYLDEVLEWY